MSDTPAARSFAALKKYVQPRQAHERCELCGRDIPHEHPHLVNRATRALVCSCDPCALLFANQEAARFSAVPRSGCILPDFQLTDEQWESLQTPINLAFFLRASPTGTAVAYYPSPAGATVSDLPAEAWRALCRVNPVLDELVPDVDALLVNRIRGTRAYFRAPIDTCYELVGLVRSGWRGISGGTEVWAEIDRFFARLKERWHA
jgi:hypothetical protein